MEPNNEVNAILTRDTMQFILQIMATARQELRPNHAEDKENLRANYLTLHNACMNVLTDYVLNIQMKQVSTETPNA